MNIACPECSTLYRIDPDRVPDGGVTTRCRECDTAFRVDPALAPAGPGELATAPRVETAEADVEDAGSPAGRSEAAPAAESTAEPEPAPTAADAPASDEAPVFGPQDPDTRARRLARALVSDIKVYHPEKWEEAMQEGTLRKEFRDEILKSWEEYVEQVGEAMAKKTPYFRDALNQILARGERVF